MEKKKVLRMVAPDNTKVKIEFPPFNTPRYPRRQRRLVDRLINTHFGIKNNLLKIEAEFKPETLAVGRSETDDGESVRVEPSSEPERKGKTTMAPKKAAAPRTRVLPRKKAAQKRVVASIPDPGDVSESYDSDDSNADIPRKIKKRTPNKKEAGEDSPSPVIGRKRAIDESEEVEEPVRLKLQRLLGTKTSGRRINGYFLADRRLASCLLERQGDRYPGSGPFTPINAPGN